MPAPDFFDAALRITVHDALAEFLGAAHQGMLEYTYADVVKLAGHSCPTVAGAFLLGYPDHPDLIEIVQASGN